jgi:hypothetical protein
MRTLAIDVWVNAPGVAYSNFRDSVSIFEYDTVFWDPANTLKSYELDPFTRFHNGQPNISRDDSPLILQDIKRRRKEFAEFLKMGRTLVIFAAPPQNFCFRPGGVSVSGAGNIRKVNSVLATAELFETCTPGICAFSMGEGGAISPKNPGFREAWRDNKGRWRYRAIIEGTPSTLLATVEGTEKIIGGVFLVPEMDGKIVVIPDLLGPDHPEEEDDEETADDPDVELSDAADSGGALPAAEWDQAHVALISWIKSLTSTDRESKPAWLSDFPFQEDVTRQGRIEDIKSQMIALSREVEILEIESDASDDWKRLIYAQGDELEEQVQAAFRLLGFDVEPGPPGRSDIRLSWNGKRAVVEVKGLGKGAGERNAAQLEKWVAGDTSEGEQTPKGILVVNGWRDRPPNKRLEPVFSHQMLDYSERREHCLVTGLQLLSMVRACMKDPTKADTLADLVLSSTGLVHGWDDLAHVFADASAAITDSQNPTDGE